ncbi:hypothetical protein POM88_032484 [Heracleum sosnowskyi]|uniref:Uncharacterized protein n=1 Tax=Heracleum sosnowskyi TaxID=360622 RepID=A0AAD8MK38_9APIA|nr:hypothetical protein POM88_032484 [Heracleum sosnowskyi]
MELVEVYRVIYDGPDDHLQGIIGCLDSENDVALLIFALLLQDVALLIFALLLHEIALLIFVLLIQEVVLALLMLRSSDDTHYVDEFDSPGSLRLYTAALLL